jgi:hypothetical protein
MEARFFDDNKAGTNWNKVDVVAATSDSLVSGLGPQTPMFAATAGTPVRFRMLHPGGFGAVPNFTLHGHVWQRRPYAKGSTEIGESATSEWTGSLGPFPANDQADIVLASAGGRNGIPGDYLYRDFLSTDFQQGSWGIFQVDPANKDTVIVQHLNYDGQTLRVTGQTSRDYKTGNYAKEVTLSGLAKPETEQVDARGAFSFSLQATDLPQKLTVKSSGGDMSVLESRPKQVIQEMSSPFQVQREPDTRLDDARRFIPQLDRILSPTSEGP